MFITKIRSFFKVFTNVVYLNRDQDLDRQEIMKKQFTEYSVPALRFSAILDGVQDIIFEPINSLNISIPQASCLVSHLEIIRKHGSHPLLVFEDDIDLSPSKYWGTSFEDIINTVPETVGIVQLQAWPAPTPVVPKKWMPGVFGTGAYFIRPWYAEKLINLGYVDGKWRVKNFTSMYVQPLADSILYSNTYTLSLQLFGVIPMKSNILPHATYPEMLYKFSESWSQGLNDMSTIKSLVKKIEVK